VNALVAGCTQSAESSCIGFYKRSLLPGERIKPYSRTISELLTKASPSLENNERTLFLKAHMAMNLPDHLKSLYEVYLDKIWDKLVGALDRASQRESANLLYQGGYD
jgi:hypothetical protein